MVVAEQLPPDPHNALGLGLSSTQTQAPTCCWHDGPLPPTAPRSILAPAPPDQRCSWSEELRHKVANARSLCCSSSPPPPPSSPEAACATLTATLQTNSFPNRETRVTEGTRKHDASQTVTTWCQILWTMRLQCVSKILTPRGMLQKT